METTFPNEATDKRLISKKKKKRQLVELNIQKTNNRIKTMGRRPGYTSLQRRHTDSQEAHEKISTLLIIREMQIKTTMSYHLTQPRMAISKNSTINKFWRGCGENGEQYGGSLEIII